MSRAIEIAATAPILALIGKNSYNRSSYYQLDDSGTQPLDLEVATKWSKFLETNRDLRRSKKRMLDAYMCDFYQSRTIPTPTITPNVGIVINVNTVYTWEEPRQFPGHKTIKNWLKGQKDIVAKIDAVDSSPKIDIRSLDKLVINKERTNMGSEGLASLGFYAPQIVALLFYEKALAKIKHGHLPHRSAEELVDMKDTLPQIQRRSFIKFIAALGGSAVTYPIVAANNRGLEERRIILEREIEELKRMRDVAGEVSFSQYFGKSPQEMIAGYKEQLGVARHMINLGVEEKEVNQGFRDVIQTNEIAIRDLESIFSDGIPVEIDERIKAHLITDRLNNKSNTEHLAVYSGLGLSAIAALGAMIGILVPLELANKHITNKGR